MKLRPSLRDRLLSFVDSSDPNSCWEWKGATQRHGYGAIERDYKVASAHRVSFELFCGPVEKGDHICHACDNPPCINPRHLFKGTRSDNMQDARKKRRLRFGRRHHWTKLSDEAVRAIQADQTSSQRKLAELYGVSQPLISMIKTKSRRPILID